MQLVKSLVFLTLFIESTCCPICASGQQSKVLSWQYPFNDPREMQVYRPEPILFVHGVNANDGSWNTAIGMLQTAFGSYDATQAIDDFVQQTNGLNVVQQAYLHTFNYGDQPGQPATHDRHSFDHVQWNAWAADRDFQIFTNEFVGVDSIFRLQLAPHDSRRTLDERINGPGSSLAFAKLTP